MKLLLDTHVLLWWLDDPSQIDAACHAEIANASNTVFVSAVVAWEIAIKRGLGKLSAPDDLAAAVAASGFTELPVTISHALATGNLPTHHRDPFDRMLVAQAICEGCTLVSRDPQIQRYTSVTHLRA